MQASIEAAGAGKLLQAVVEVSDSYRTLADRRQALLECLAGLLQAKSGHWTWGRGREDSERRTGMAFLPFGYSEGELRALVQFMTDAQVQQELQRLLLAHLHRCPRADGTWTVTVAEAFAADDRPPDSQIVAGMREIGVAHWLQGGRYLPNDTFTVVVLGRGEGQPPFSEGDKALMELAITSIPWLWANAEEAIGEQAVSALSPRQRGVMFLLLDGLSRKKIAARLQISEETVSTHVKAIFQHFQVQSAMELAALFLRSQ